MNIQEELINRAGGRSYVLNLPDRAFESFNVNGRYGAKLKSGLVIISPTFDDYFDFCGGIAIVQKNRKYGAINKLGELILPIQYDCLGNYYEGLARIKINNKWGYINACNQVIIPCCYEDAGNFNQGVAPVREKGMWYYIYANNKLAILPQQSYKRVEDFKEGFAVVCDNYDRYGFINMKGEEVIRTKYEEVKPFINERALVRINGKYGFIDYEGHLVIPAIYCSAYSFGKNGLAMVDKIEPLSRDRVTLYINKCGKVVREEYRQKGVVREVAENSWKIAKWLNIIFRGG